MANGQRARHIESLRRNGLNNGLQIANDPQLSPACRSVIRQMLRYNRYAPHCASPLQQVVNVEDADKVDWGESSDTPFEYASDASPSLLNLSPDAEDACDEYMSGLWGDDLTGSRQPDYDWRDDVSTPIDPRLQAYKNHGQHPESAGKETNRPESSPKIRPADDADAPQKHGRQPILIPLPPMDDSDLPCPHHSSISTVAQAADVDRVPDISLAEEQDPSPKRRRYDMTEDDEEEGSEFVAYMHAS